MKVKWLGHSCFLMTSESGIRILTDPFDEKTGYLPPAVEADIVTTSHSHFDHGYIQVVKGSFIHLSNPGNYNPCGLVIIGFSTFHDEAGGKKRGGNIVYIFEIDGIRLCHCGDLGHIPSPQQLMEIGKIDILLVPVGGTFTLDAAQAYELVKLINPAVTIPMHYKTPALTFPIDGIDKFLKESGVLGTSGVFINKQEIELTRSSLDAFPHIVVLDYKLSAACSL